MRIQWVLSWTNCSNSILAAMTPNLVNRMQAKYAVRPQHPRQHGHLIACSVHSFSVHVGPSVRLAMGNFTLSAAVQHARCLVIARRAAPDARRRQKTTACCEPRCCGWRKSVSSRNVIGSRGPADES